WRRLERLHWRLAPATASSPGFTCAPRSRTAGLKWARELFEAQAVGLGRGAGSRR
ncbi:unnamed protein product, partial [Symbiodinium sp. CCMP2456]